jgi:hypothetical protein
MDQVSIMIDELFTGWIRLSCNQIVVAALADLALVEQRDHNESK